MPTTIEDRIAELESSNRRLRLMLLGVAVVGAAGLGLGMTRASRVPDVIQAKKFEVVNDDGVPVVTLKSWKFGGWIDTTDNDGNWLFTVASSDGDGGGKVTTFSGELFNKQLVDISAGFGEDHVGRAGIISTFNDNGETLVLLTGTDTGEGAIRTHNAVGEEVVRIGASRGAGTVLTFNSDGKAVVMIGAGPDDDGLVAVQDRRGALKRALSGGD